MTSKIASLLALAAVAASCAPHGPAVPPPADVTGPAVAVYQRGGPGSVDNPRPPLADETGPARWLPSLPRPNTEYEGAAALGLALRRVGPTQRVLMIGAHPDDEYSPLLAELALGHGADVAYLSLTRGEGGQNLIGGELGPALGLIRTGELLSARRLDGAVQFFSRAYDFGFSKSAEEAYTHWPRDSVLADVVETIRLWRPDVVIAVFSGTPRDGHGQHQVSGQLAREAFGLAGDPSAFPEQVARGEAPFAPSRLYQSLWRPAPGEATVTIETGEMDPLLGRSHYQLSLAGRSRHRSQDMGAAQPPGSHPAALKLIAPEGAPASGVFAGLDTLLSQRADGSVRIETLNLLRRYEDAAGAARAGFNPSWPGAAVVPALEVGLARLDSVLPLLERGSELRFDALAERRDVAAALARARGVVLRATTDRATLSPGDSLRLTLTLWNGGATPLSVRHVEPDLPRGWWAETADAPIRSLAPGDVATRTFVVHLPADAAVGGPYFLRQPPAGDMYRWPADPALRGRAFAPPPLVGLAVVDDDVPLSAPAEYLVVDPAYGERRAPLLVLPAVAVDVAPEVTVLRSGATAPVSLDVKLTRNVGAPVAGRLQVDVPAGWSATVNGRAAPAPLTLTAPTTAAKVTLTPPANPTSAAQVAVSFVADSGRAYGSSAHVVDYPHIAPHVLTGAAEAVVRPVDVRVPRVRVGYVPGSGDDVPAAIAALGLRVDTLDAAALRSGDLGRWDVIVTGIRAYEVRDDLPSPEVRSRLERWVRAGGALVVQYNKYEFADDHDALLPLTMARPHDRVTDENAAVTVLAPDHPILTTPNRIGPADWQGWIQERGLYFAHTWDPGYTPLLEMADAGEAPMRGSLLAARMGRGWYVYTGLALFRQLPAGVPGAYRLLANLLALGSS